ncbi:hypothetical protein FOA52_004636 [Chlamydomonas sp. UWO 241]|nr:hypothetical protein FOA52_004636 [Chlamydomonas sp. UWO 241]
MVRVCLNADIRLLLSKRWGASYTCWHVAAHKNHLDVLKVLEEAVMKNVDAVMKLNSGWRRCISAQKEAEQLLHGMVHETARYGVTPLILAAASGHTAVIEFLVSIGADRWQGDIASMSPLHFAARAGRTAAVAELLKDPPPRSHMACRLCTLSCKLLEALDGFGWTALHYAMAHKHEGTVAALLSYEANLMPRTQVYHPGYGSLPVGTTPLHIAAALGHLPLIKTLLRAYYVRNGNLLPNSLGPDERRVRSRRNPDLRLILTRTRRIAFHIAARHQHTDVLEWLDPSIPLSFLLAGSAEDTVEGSLLPAVGVPRLGVLAANALHAALASDLRAIEAEVAAVKAANEAAAAARKVKASGHRSATKPSFVASLARAASLGATPELLVVVHPTLAPERTPPAGGVRDSLARLGSLLLGGSGSAVATTLRDSEAGTASPNAGGPANGGTGGIAAAGGSAMVTPRGGGGGGAGLVSPRDRSKPGTGGQDTARGSTNGGVPSLRQLAQQAEQADADARGQRRLIDMLSANLLKNWKTNEKRPVVPPEPHSVDLVADALYNQQYEPHAVDARDALDNNYMGVSLPDDPSAEDGHVARVRHVADVGFLTYARHPAAAMLIRRFEGCAQSNWPSEGPGQPGLSPGADAGRAMRGMPESELVSMVQSALRFSDPGTPTGLRSAARSAHTTANDGQLGFPSALDHSLEWGDKGSNRDASPGRTLAQVRARLALPATAPHPTHLRSRSLQWPAGAAPLGYRGARKSQLAPFDIIRMPTAPSSFANASAAAAAATPHLESASPLNLLDAGIVGSRPPSPHLPGQALRGGGVGVASSSNRHGSPANRHSVGGHAASTSGGMSGGHESNDDDADDSGSLGEPEPSPEPGIGFGPSSSGGGAAAALSLCVPPSLRPLRVGSGSCGVGVGGCGGDASMRPRWSADTGADAASGQRGAADATSWHPGQLSELRASVTSQSATEMLSSLEGQQGALGGHAGVMGGEAELAEPTANGGLFKLFKSKKKNQILPIPGHKGSRIGSRSAAAGAEFKNLSPPAAGRMSMPGRMSTGSLQPLDYEALDDSDASLDEDGAAAQHLGEVAEEEGASGGQGAQEDDTCPVCLDESPNVVLRTCGHRLCLGCAQDLCKRHVLTPVLCPYCRSVISGFTGAPQPKAAAAGTVAASAAASMVTPPRAATVALAAV